MYYGFDMGGTKIELAVFNEALEPVWQKAYCDTERELRRAA